MGYTTPPGFADVISGALAVGTVNAVILAAPGATSRYRIVGWDVGINRSVAAAIVDVRIFETTSGVTLGRYQGLSIAGQPDAGRAFDYPGVGCTLNNGITIAFTSTVAAGAAFGMIWYYIDLQT